jgi:hypothetical protein
MLEAAPHYKTQFPAGHEERGTASGGKSSGRHRVAAKTAAIAGSERRDRRPLRK